jgi:hypothetical protein
VGFSSCHAIMLPAILQPSESGFLSLTRQIHRPDFASIAS